MEQPVQHPLHPLLPADPLIAEGPGARARAEARTGLYVHVPFCTVRCTYCHFDTATFEHGLLERWLEAMKRECALRAPAAGDATFGSVFLGGGTPSAISARHFRGLARTLREHFRIDPDAEFTLEANPETVRAPLLEAWREAGVNRLSLGAQSFEPAELELLGRVHGATRPAEAIAAARAAGFRRLSLDLMFGFPGHTREAFGRTLGRALSLEPEHVSAYAFVVEAGNPLSDAVLAGRLKVVDDERQAELYEDWLAACAAAGLAPYETSNACRPGAEARHNLTYWLRRDCMALGPSAHGLWRGERWGNLRGTARWAAALEAGLAPEGERERPDPAQAAEEAMMLGLRLATGLDPADYEPWLECELERRFGAAFEDARAAGRLERAGARWRVPRAQRFVADDTIAWIAARARN